jgi:hypothetical protein
MVKVALIIGLALSAIACNQQTIKKDELPVTHEPVAPDSVSVANSESVKSESTVKPVSSVTIESKPVDWPALGAAPKSMLSMSVPGYEVQERGTVLAVQSHKEWMACSLGQVWRDKRCVGTVQHLTYDEALLQVTSINQDQFAGFSDWRLPTSAELLSLLNPSFPVMTFSQSLPLHYWTSEGAQSADQVLVVNFRTAKAMAWPSSSRFAVRLVRDTK